MAFMMIKKATILLAVCLCILIPCFPVLAEESADAPAETKGALYGGYDDDEWFNNGYEGIENKTPDEDAAEELQPWYRSMSVAPVVLGVLVGAAVVFVLYRNSRPEPPSAVPYEPRAEVSVAAQRDRQAKVTRTKRNLSGTDNRKA